MKEMQAAQYVPTTKLETWSVFFYSRQLHMESTISHETKYLAITLSMTCSNLNHS